MPRHLPGYIAAAVVTLPVLIFIALPLGAMLVESFRVSGPLGVQRLRSITAEALDVLPVEQRASTVESWVASATPRQRMETIAVVFEILGEPVSWDRKANYDDQIAAAEAALAVLPSKTRLRFDIEYPSAVIMLHKRIPLAFAVKRHLSAEAFDVLRTGEEKRFGLDNYLAVLIEDRIQVAARNSITLALLACFFVTPLAFLLAYAVNRGTVPRPTLTRFAILIPLVSPPVIIAFAAILLFGRQGVITKDILDSTFGFIDANVTNLYGIQGVVTAQVLSFTPVAFIILDNVLSRQDGRLEESAASQGATHWQSFTRVTIPMAVPGLVRAFILVFILSMTDFGNPLVIGKDIPVVAGIIYDEMIGFSNTRLSAALCVWLILPAGLVYFAMERVFLVRKRFVSSGETGVPSEVPLPKLVGTALFWVVTTYLALVLSLYASVAVGSFTKVWGQDYGLTLDHYRDTSEVYGFISDFQGLGVVWQSLGIASIAAPIGGLFAIVVAYVIERVRPPGRQLINFVVLLPAVLPGVIFGVGYLVAFSQPLGINELALTGTATILLTNILFGNMFVGVLAARALLQRLDSSIEEAAESLGASLVQRFTLVVAPMLRHPLLLGALYVFVDGMTTLSAVIFLVSPDHHLASVAIFDHASNAYYGLACAESVAILLIVAIVMSLMAVFEKSGSHRLRAVLVPRVA